MSYGDSRRAARGLPERGSTFVIVLAALFAVGAIVEAVRLNSLGSPEVWGHLRAGTWILEKHSFPRTGLFSQSVNRPWRDFSWGFDVILAALFQVVGLRALPGMTMGFRVVLAVVLFLLAGGRRSNVWGAGVLTLVGIYALFRVGPGSTTASVVLLGLELTILLEWRRLGSKFQRGFVLPVLFWLWANLDVGFVYGIAVLALYVASLYVQPVSGGVVSGDRARKLPHIALLALLASVLASGITPYGYAGYTAFWQMETSVANGSIPGYAAMGFRQPPDYAVLLLGMSAFLAMGLRRSRDVFLFGLLSGSAILAFHSQQESWLLVVSAVAVIGWMIAELRENESAKAAGLSERRLIAVAGSSLALTALVFFLLLPRDPEVLMARAGETLPVKACDFIRHAGLAQPLFNAYRWGAFVSWYLPEYPVAIDARRGLYSEDMEDGYFKVMKADMPYQAFPAMRDAKTILLEKSSVMAEALKDVRGFHVAYEDSVATVLSQGAQP